MFFSSAPCHFFLVLVLFDHDREGAAPVEEAARSVGWALSGGGRGGGRTGHGQIVLWDSGAGLCTAWVHGEQLRHGYDGFAYFFDFVLSSFLF